MIGALIGITMSVPVGPSGVIGVKRIISRGMQAGLASGVGVAIGDMIFATLAVAGISSVSEFLANNARVIQMIGALVIIFVGIYGFRKGASIKPVSIGKASLHAVKDFISMLVITLANPQTIIGFSTSFAATVALYSVETGEQIISLIGGVFAGSIAMWSFLSWFVSRWHGALADDLIVRLHRYASLLIIFIGFSLFLYALMLGESLKLV